jgi:hypothetical protein
MAVSSVGRPWRPWRATRAARDGESRKSEGECKGGVGSSVSTSGRQGRGRDACREGQARSRAWPTRPGHVASLGAFQQAHGSLRSGQGGGRFWASSGLNLDRGQLSKLFSSVCSTIFI